MKDKDLPVYLDYNATTPVHPEVADEMVPFLRDNFGNPSSSHYYGRVASEAVRKARKQVSELLGCKAEEIVFTSGGTESDNYSLKGYAWANIDRGNHIITSSIEHPAILNVCRYLELTGFNVTYLPVDKFGMVSPEDVGNAINDETILISIMHANNEVGTIQPIREIADIAQGQNVVFHTDAAQSIGKIPCRINDLCVDMLTVAGHKLYAAKGVGALYIRSGIELVPLIHGAAHESGRRASTENVPGIVGLGKACELIHNTFAGEASQLLHLRDRLHKLLEDSLPDVQLNGHPEQRLPNTLSLSFRDINAGDLLQEVKDKIAVSGGAACHDNDVEISHVLKAMGIARDWAVGTVRFSLGSQTTEADIDRAADLICDAVKKLRSSNPGSFCAGA